MDDLFELMPVLLEVFPDSEEVRQAVVFAIFRKAAGEGLSDNAIPKDLRSKKLTVLIADPVWQRHLKSLAPQLVSRINKLARKSVVNFIEFQVDEAIFADRPRTKKQAAECKDKSTADCVGEELKKSAGLIRDTELRRLFLESAGVYLAARDKRNTNG